MSRLRAERTWGWSFGVFLVAVDFFAVVLLEDVDLLVVLLLVLFLLAALLVRVFLEGDVFFFVVAITLCYAVLVNGWQVGQKKDDRPCWTIRFIG